MPQLSPPSSPHPFGTTRGSLPDSAYENQRETARFAPENRVLIGSLRRSAARPTGDRGYVARPLIKGIDVRPEGATGRRELPKNRNREQEKSHELIRRPERRAIHKPRFLLRQAARTYPPPCSLFFCAHKSVGGRIATMMMDRAARRRAGKWRNIVRAGCRSRFNAPHRARTDCRGTKDLCPKYA